MRGYFADCFFLMRWECPYNRRKGRQSLPELELCSTSLSEDTSKGDQNAIEESAADVYESAKN